MTPYCMSDRPIPSCFWPKLFTLTPRHLLWLDKISVCLQPRFQQSPSFNQISDILTYKPNTMTENLSKFNTVLQRHPTEIMIKILTLTRLVLKHDNWVWFVLLNCYLFSIVCICVLGAEEKTNVELIVPIGSVVIAMFFWLLIVFVIRGRKRVSNLQHFHQ